MSGALASAKRTVLRLVEGASQHEPRILDRVVVIHPRIAFRLYREVHAGVVGEQVQKMVQESNTRSYLGTTFAIELYANPDERLDRLTLSISLARHLPPGSLEKSILADNGSSISS
jgi:hypothetical protein